MAEWVSSSTLFLIFMVGMCTAGDQAPIQPTSVNSGAANNFTLAILRPFIESDSGTMINAMQNQKAWKEACSASKTGPPIDLVFYFNKDIDLLPKIKSQLERLSYENHIDQCFNSVKVVSANLRPDMDGYPRGSCNQFFRLFVDDATRSLIGSYNLIFYMEPDITPLQPHWMDKMQNQASKMMAADQWVSGPTYDSMYVPDAQKSTACYRDNHINGNALYRFDSNQYNSFLRNAYTDATDSCNFGDYDHRVWQYMISQHTDLWSRFQRTDLIAHVKASAPWDPELSFTEAQSRYPEAVLIHSLPLKGMDDKSVIEPFSSTKHKAQQLL